MTLNITVAARDLVFQSSDTRLSVWDRAAGRYRVDRVKAHKQVPVFGRDWAASVCYTGVGRTRSVDVSEWLAKALGPVSELKRDFEDVVGELLRADEWLRWVPRSDRRHTFTVGAFVGGESWVVVVSNFQEVTGRTAPEAQDRLFVTRMRVRRPVAVVTGARGVVSRDDRRLLARTVPTTVAPAPTHNPPPAGVSSEGTFQLSVAVGAYPEGIGMLERIARVNQRAAASTPSVSRECVAVLLQRDGQAWFFPAGYSEDEDFVPAFARPMLDGVRYSRKRDERGMPQPVRLKQIMVNKRIDPDAIAVASVWSGLEEPPS